MPNHNAAVPSPELLDRELKVLDLRRAGLTWQRIAEEVGYADHTGAYAAYKRALKRTLQQPADELRQQEVDRVDRLQLALWPNAMRGDVRAVLAINKLMERRARLLGLDMPIKIAQDVTVWNGDESIDRAVRDLAALLTANDADSTSQSPMAEQTSQGDATSAGEQLDKLAHLVGPRMGENENWSGVDSLGGYQTTQDTMGSDSENTR